MTARRREQDEVHLQAFGFRLGGKGRQGVRAAQAIAICIVAAVIVIGIVGLHDRGYVGFDFLWDKHSSSAPAIEAPQSSAK